MQRVRRGKLDRECSRAGATAKGVHDSTCPHQPPHQPQEHRWGTLIDVLKEEYTGAPCCQPGRSLPSQALGGAETSALQPLTPRRCRWPLPRYVSGQEQPVHPHCPHPPPHQSRTRPRPQTARGPARGQQGVLLAQQGAQRRHQGVATPGHKPHRWTDLTRRRHWPQPGPCQSAG